MSINCISIIAACRKASSVAERRESLEESLEERQEKSERDASD